MERESHGRERVMIGAVAGAASHRPHACCTDSVRACNFEILSPGKLCRAKSGLSRRVSE